MNNFSTTLLSNSTYFTIQTSTLKSISSNETIFNMLSNLLNYTLYKHQEGNLLEPEKYSAGDIHVMIWILSIFTYALAIPIAIRIVRSRAYLNVIDYFSLHIIICAFVAWIPSLILLLYQWFQLFTLRLCRLHYVILSTNETVPLFFILYMIVERFLYAHPAIKQKLTIVSKKNLMHLYALFTWLLIMLIYAWASPFTSYDLNSTISLYTKKYCPYNYSKLHIIASVCSIISFCLLLPALILIGFVLRYFYLMRRTNQVPPIEKLWTIRVTSLLCIVVFYDVYLYYLEHISETYKSFLAASILHSTFYLTQLSLIAVTEPYWLAIFYERFNCICSIFGGQRRKRTTPVAMTTETEINTLPDSSLAGHYSLIDNTINDESNQVSNELESTVRVIV